MSETAIATITGPRGMALNTVDNLEALANFIASSPFSRFPFKNQPREIVAAIAYGMDVGE